VADASTQQAGGGTPPNPYVWESPDYQGNKIGISVTWNAGTGALTGATAYRDDACVYKKIYFGVGGDGTPDTTGHVINVASGSHNVPAGQLGAVGLDVIGDVVAGQITAGP
jgi:hypothetical protein